MLCLRPYAKQELPERKVPAMHVKKMNRLRTMDEERVGCPAFASYREAPNHGRAMVELRVQAKILHKPLHDRMHNVDLKMVKVCFCVDSSGTVYSLR